jgi:hypothetical protein
MADLLADVVHPVEWRTVAKYSAMEGNFQRSNDKRLLGTHESVWSN